MFGKKDRLKHHKQTEKDKEELDKEYKKMLEEEAELFKKIGDEIRLIGTEELKKSWTKYNSVMLGKSITQMAHNLVMGPLGDVMLQFQKSMTHSHLKCMKDGCDDYLLPDGIYIKNPKPEHEWDKEMFEEIKNQFVCFGCGTKHKLVKK